MCSCTGMYLLFVFTSKSPPVTWFKKWWPLPLSTLLTCTEATSHVPAHPLAHWMFPLQALSIPINFLITVCRVNHTGTQSCYYTMILLLAWTNSFLVLLFNCVVLLFFVFLVKSCPALSGRVELFSNTIHPWWGCPALKPVNTSTPVLHWSQASEHLNSCIIPSFNHSCDPFPTM